MTARPSANSALEKLGLPPERAALLEAHLALVRRWNRAFNLVSARDAGRLETRHLLDSLALVEWVGSARSLLDIGSGAGFPGLTLAIALGLPAVLVERSIKKARFLRQAVIELGLGRVDVLAEDVRRLAPDRRFDIITARAVADPPTVWELARSHLTPSGRLLLQTGSPVVSNEDPGGEAGSAAAAADSEIAADLHQRRLTFAGGIVQDAAPSHIGWITAIGLKHD